MSVLRHMQAGYFSLTFRGADPLPTGDPGDTGTGTRAWAELELLLAPAEAEIRARSRDNASSFELTAADDHDPVQVAFAVELSRRDDAPSVREQVNAFVGCLYREPDSLHPALCDPRGVTEGGDDGDVRVWFRFQLQREAQQGRPWCAGDVRSPEDLAALCRLAQEVLGKLLEHQRACVRLRA